MELDYSKLRRDLVYVYYHFDSELEHKENATLDNALPDKDGAIYFSLI